MGVTSKGQLQNEFGVDGKFDASEEIAVGVRSLGQHGFGTFDRHVGVLMERATAGKASFGNDVTQNSSALAVIGYLLQSLADVIVGARSEMLVSDWNAGKDKAILFQGHFNLDGSVHVLESLGFQRGFNRSGENDGILFHFQLFDVKRTTTA